jgi:hypothetical protein
MKTLPCKLYYNGSILKSDNCTYEFKQAIRSEKEISYENNEIGCRVDYLQDIETKCLTNNFNEYKK